MIGSPRRTTLIFFVSSICALLLAVSLLAAPGPSTEPMPPTLTADASVITQRVTLSDGTRSGGEVSFVGTGFTPNAVLSLYVTFPDGTNVPAVNLQSITHPLPCCLQNDQTLADGTGNVNFTLWFGDSNDVPANAPDSTPATIQRAAPKTLIFLVRSTNALAVLPYGAYIISASGKRNASSATLTPTPAPLEPELESGNIFADDTTRTASTIVTIQGSTRDDFARSTTGRMTVYTTIGHRKSAQHFDLGQYTSGNVEDSSRRSTVPNPSVGQYTNGNINDYSTRGAVPNPSVDIVCNGLLPGEATTFWDIYPDGTVWLLRTVSADDGGSALIQVELLTGTFPIGLHMFSCRGYRSNYTFSDSFLVLPGNQPATATPVPTLRPRSTSGVKIVCQRAEGENEGDTRCRPTLIGPVLTPTPFVIPSPTPTQ